ncbi:MAG: aspartate aminotransferase family protein, partial [Gammaproteobacteria bacterium]
DKASNARQWDVDGREFIDMFAGAGVLNYGHNNERLRKAMIEYMQADGVAHSLDMHSRSKREFMLRFEDIILKPRKLSYKLQFTGPTGTNVVEAALKLARKVTGRRSVVAFTDGFHGMTLGSLACTGNSHYRHAAGVPLNDVVRVPFDGYLGKGVSTLEPLRRLLEDQSSGLEPPAAFLVETVQAEGGVNVASKEWLQSLQELARSYDSFFIIDDIQVGNGRTGNFFSWETLDLDPDLVCLAKGIGGFGTPMGLLLVRPTLDQWGPGEHTGTFRGQNLSFVAGGEALEYYRDDKLMKAVHSRGEYMRERLESMVAEYGKGRFETRGRGMIRGLDTGSGETAAAIIKAAFAEGVILATCGPSGRVVKMTPPLTIEDDTLEKGLDLAEKAVARGVSA